MLAGRGRGPAALRGESEWLWWISQDLLSSALQVEMFLLGYALRCTIQVYRLYMSGTEEFLTYYPDDHRDDWPAVSLVTEDDRHYNVPVVTAIAAPEAASR